MLIPNFLVSGQSGLKFSEYRGIPHFSGKIYFLIYQYLINQYLVKDDADSELLVPGQSGLKFSEYRGIPHFSEKIFFPIF